MKKGFLRTEIKSECFGCEACAQSCPKLAIEMKEDCEGFRYPVVNSDLCIQCGICNKVCPVENMPLKYSMEQLAFGGYIYDDKVRNESTSGGAFSAIVETWCDENYIIFGATAEKLKIYHTYIADKKDLYRFRKSKYSQSIIGDSYKQVKAFLESGKKVLFSGTPCQIAALRAYLQNIKDSNLLTVEVICEGVPSPLFIHKYDSWMQQKYGASIESLDYRYKDGRKWDFQVMSTLLKNKRCIKIDRWFNPFWSIWLNHYMSRPSCYECPFATTGRVADISLGDLWGVHLYCPELYGGNKGASLVLCNTDKGRYVLDNARYLLYGHDLPLASVLKYQSPMRKPIALNPLRYEFMMDLTNPNIGYKKLCSRWAMKPGLILLWQKYVWGNHQKVFLWNLKQRLK